MKILTFTLFMCNLLLVQLKDGNRYTYCETCLKAAQGLERAIKEAPAASRKAVVEKLLSGELCEKLVSHNHDQISKDKLASSCAFLLEANYKEFHAALLDKEPENLNVLLCYEQSNACVGVKLQTFEDSKGTFTAADIDALLHENKEKVRIARPVHPGPSVHPGDEL
ncbi:uncharacterized protein KZ484_005330 [Pholidichthys leucotaenia]